MGTHKVSAEEEYESTGGARNLGSIRVEDVEVGIDEEYELEYEFLRARKQTQLKFIFRTLQQIEKRLGGLERS